MEYGSDTGLHSSSPEKDGEQKGTSKKAESLKPALDKLFEKQNQHETAEKIAKSETIWQRLTGRTPEVAPTDSATQTTPETKDQNFDEGEIILSQSDQHEIASEYVDLRREVVADEVMGAGALPEAVADDQLLATAQEQLAHSGPQADYTQTIDHAYARTARAIEHQPSGTLPPAGESTAMDWQAHRRAAEAADHQDTPEASPPVHESAAPQPEWYDKNPAERWYYPRAWPPQPEKSMLDKVSEERREHARDQRKKKDIKQQLQHEMQAVQGYIDTKEQAIRSLAAERHPAPTPEQAPAPVAAKASERPQPPRPVSAEHAPALPHPEQLRGTTEVSGLHRREALELSKKIIIDGTSLHEQYRAKHITEPGLHHVLNEYLRGGDVRRALAQELLVKEMAYERDPFMRNMLVAADAQSPRSGSSSPSDAVAPQDDSAPAAGGKSSQKLTKPAAASTPAAPAARPGGTGQVLFRAWVVFVIVLAIIAAILLFK